MNPIKKIHAWNLNRKQSNLNKEYEKNGFTNEILEKQVAINEARHKHDITDESKIIHEKFVQ